MATVFSRSARSRWPLAMNAAASEKASRTTRTAATATTARTARWRRRMCSPIRESFGTCRIAAARSATASCSRGSADRRLPAWSRAQRRSTQRGSSLNACPRASLDSAVVAAQSRSPAVSSQTRSPPVTAMSRWFIGRWARHQEISRDTQPDCADSGEAIRISQEESASASSIVVHRCGEAARLVWSRNTCSARIRYQGLAKRCSSAWSRAVIAASSR